MKLVCRLPQGQVILPGLDQESDDEVWGEIQDDPSHPQFGMADLLRQLEAERGDISIWPVSKPSALVSLRSRFINTALQPARGDVALARSRARLRRG